MTSLTTRLHPRWLHSFTALITRSTARPGRVSADATFCDSCGQVCTADCRRAALLERSVTNALHLAPMR